MLGDVLNMKLFASDYDGTLRTKDMVSQADKDAICAWRKAGNAFGVVTGRSMESIQSDLQLNEIEVDFVVGNNGGAIYDANFKELKTYFIEFHKAKEIIRYLKSENCISYVLNDGYARAKVLLDAKREDKKYATFSSTISEKEILERRSVAQIVASLENDEDTMRIASYIEAHFASSAVGYRNINCVDIIPYGISKATGVSYMVKQLQVSHEDVYTIGDSYNDIPMLETYHGFAMAQAVKQVKSYAQSDVISVAQAILQVLTK